MNHNLFMRTTQALFISVGGVGTIAFEVTLTWWLRLASIAFLGATWYMLYVLLKGVQADAQPIIEHGQSGAR